MSSLRPEIVPFIWVFELSGLLGLSCTMPGRGIGFRYYRNNMEAIAMKIWELLPMNRDNPNWEASTYNGRVVIRAPTAERARHIAHSAFTIATLHVPGTEIKYTPWAHHDMVVCCELMGSDFTADGDDTILDPAEYDSEWRG